MTENDYLTVIVTTAAEFPAYIVAISLIDLIGRKKTMALMLLIAAVSTFCLTKCRLMSRGVIELLLFCSRGAAAGWAQVLYVYTPEVYATKLRAVAIGRL